MPRRVKTDPYKYVQSLYTVKFKSVDSGTSIGVPCNETEISSTTLDWAGLNSGVNGTYGDTGLDTDYWISICPPISGLTYSSYAGSLM